MRTLVGNFNVAFLGAGSMAESILSGLLQQNRLSPDKIYVTNRQNKERLTELHERYGIQVSSSNEYVLKNADIVILAMKPKGVREAVESIRAFTREDQLFISVLAGITTDYLTYLLGHHAPVLRVMPNTSAAVGSSATVIASGKYVKDDHIKIGESLFEAVGLVKLVKEEQLDVITALAGSGPAYIYYLIEALYSSAEKLGLEQKLTKELTLQMIQGAVDLLRQTDQEPAQLYQSVKSPGGTTEAGLSVLEKREFQEIIAECLTQATTRSKEITEQLSVVPL